ncbi:hydrogenase expression/formation protein HypE [Selenomonas flueggei]|uniref:Hydrogenase expression/formation protein HypE n=1 Tax=Selenomonas flueggei ATCC 43531 TaxID=638302 RepID=C4V238_9FIRM|nr:hydrogenase expression/formation protein HypE [Selenomonas flueggei]EEQ49077.1 hydrogenase expression/formation protein HypE [Selenomonas flueggei ATCC 43531]
MEHDVITMAHGAGGQLSHALMEEVVLPALGNTLLNVLHDGAVLPLTGRTAFTTDSYVVQPHFFPGGSIGRLAVCGTVNDLSMTGAAPAYLSLAVILEEGFPIAALRRIVADIAAAAEEAGVSIVTGDTKVVPRGCGDGIYINTAGVGTMLAGADIAPTNITAGMDIIVSGTLGDHAATVMAARHGLTLPPEIQSDCAPLCHLTAEMIVAAGDGIAVLRDPTRGGAAASLNELAGAAGVGVLLDEEQIPVRPAVQGVCEMLGFDPLTLANEGKLLAFVRPDVTARVLDVMHENPYGREACVIGHTTADAPGTVGLRTALGGIRVVDLPLGELVPRIC